MLRPFFRVTFGTQERNQNRMEKKRCESRPLNYFRQCDAISKIHKNFDEHPYKLCSRLFSIEPSCGGNTWLSQSLELPSLTSSERAIKRKRK